MIACAKGVARAAVKVAQGKDVRLRVADGVTIVLEDHGQDFLEFDIRDGCIVQTRPSRGDLWNGLQVLNCALAQGDVIWLRMPWGETTLNYPVAAIRPLDRVRIGATDV